MLQCKLFVDFHVRNDLQRSWCSIEVELSGHKSILRSPSPEWAAKPAPQLKVAAINLKTYINPNTQINEIVVASVVHVDGIKCDGPTEKAHWNSRIKHFSGVTKLRSQPWPPGKFMISGIHSIRKFTGLRYHPLLLMELRNHPFSQLLFRIPLLYSSL